MAIEPPSQQQLLPQQVCESMLGSLFYIRSYFGHGTGFVVFKTELESGNSAAYIATANHVVEQAMKARAEIELRHETSGRIFIANPSAYEIDRAGSRDISFCLIRGPLPEDLAVVREGPDNLWLMRGCRVFWMGYTGVVAEIARAPVACVFTGIVSASYGSPEVGNPETKETMYVLDGRVLPGNSGGPVFAEDGSVIGVLVARGGRYDKKSGAQLTEGVALAVPLWEARNVFLAKASKQPPLPLTPPVRGSKELGSEPNEPGIAGGHPS